VEEALSVLTGALRTLEAAGGDDLLEGDIRNNLAIVETVRLSWSLAEEELTRAEALYERTGMSGRTAMVWQNRAWARGLQGDVPGSLSAFDEAARRYRDAGMSAGLLPVERAEALLSAGLVVEAREAAAAAVAEFTRQGNKVDLVQARILLAEAMLLDDDATAAGTVAAAARRAAVGQGRPGWAALAAFAELRAKEDAGVRPGALLAPGRRVAADLGEAGWLPQSLDAMLIVARAAVRTGRAAEARTALDAVRQVRRRGPAAVRVRAWHAEALHRRAAGDLRGARYAVSAGLRVVDDFRASLGATDLRAHVALLAARLADLGLALALESGRPVAVLSAAEASRASALWLRPVSPADHKGMDADLAELRRLDADRRSGEIPPHAGRAREVALEQAIRDRARHATTGDARRTRGAPGRLDIPALQSALGDRVLVELVSRDGDLSAVVVTAASTRLVPLGPQGAVADDMDALLAGLRWLATGVPGSVSAAAKLVERSAARLDETLLGPCLNAAGPAFGAGAPEGTGAVPMVLVPGGRFSALPWAALRSLAVRSFTVAPSAATWLRSTKAADGDHDAGSGDDRGDGAVGTTAPTGRRIVLAHGPGLPGAAREIRRLAAAYPGAEVLTGGEATVAAVLARMDGADVVHLAAHGRLRVDNPMFSALDLADGPLTVHDLERLTAAPRLVVLASCDAGLGSVHPGDEVVGLATSLLALGTSSVVAPVLVVPDDATARMMTGLHRGRRSGSSPAVAMAGARGPLVRAEWKPADVVTSAGFTCFGAG
jgi:hypothetical protein